MEFTWVHKLAILLLILFIIYIISYLIKQAHIEKLERRFGPYSLHSIVDDDISWFDKIEILIKNYLIFLTKILSKSKFITNYSKKYDKYITYEEKERVKGISFIAIKINISLILILLSIIARGFNIISILISFIVGFYLLDLVLYLNFKRKRKKVEEDLLRAIIIMNNSFKAGKNIMEAINTVKTELEGPISDEFKKIYLDMTYGLSLDVVFNRFYERVKLEDAKYITSSLTLLNKTGGNIVKVFNTIEHNFYNKKKLSAELKSLTSSSVFVFRVLVCLPIIFTLVVLVLNPTYFTPLFNTTLGIIILIFIVLLYILYIMVIKKVLEVEMI